jgi:hypothetical protein
MNVTQLQEAVTSLKDSSAFRFGDATTFDVCFLRHEVELPGKCNAADYLKGLKQRLRVLVPEGGRVAVVCPGNGGLIPELLMAGAAEVLAIEPRPRYHDALERVVPLLGAVHEGSSVTTFRAWPKPGLGKMLRAFDLIIWSEGLEECLHPAASLGTVASLLAPGGTFVIEVVHGEQGAPLPILNSWRPTKEAWDAFFSDTFGDGDYSLTHGRAAGRYIYRVRLGGELQAKGPELAKPVPLPPHPRSKETDELAAKAEQPEPVPDTLPAFPREPEPALAKPAPPPPPPPEKAHLPPFPRDPELKTVHRVGSTQEPEAPAPKEESVDKKDETETRRVKHPLGDRLAPLGPPLSDVPAPAEPVTEDAPPPSPPPAKKKAKKKTTKKKKAKKTSQRAKTSSDE